MTEKPNPEQLSFAEAKALLTERQAAFVDAYLLLKSKAAAAREAGLGRTPDSIRQAGVDTYNHPGVRAAIDAGFRESRMSDAELLERIDEQARSGLQDVLTQVEREVDNYGMVPVDRALADLRLQQAEHELLAQRLQDLDADLAAHHKNEAARLQIEIVRLEVKQELDPKAKVRHLIGKRKVKEEIVDLVKVRERGKLHLIQELSYKEDGTPRVKMVNSTKAQEVSARARGLLHDNTKHSGEVSLKLIKETVGGPLD